MIHRRIIRTAIIGKITERCAGTLNEQLDLISPMENFIRLPTMPPSDLYSPKELGSRLETPS